MADEEEAQLRALREERLALGGAAAASDDVYGGGGRDRSAYVAELDVGEADGMEEDEEEGAAAGGEVARRMASYTAPKALLAEVPRGEVEDAEQARVFACALQVLGLQRGTPSD
jgi:splicing factor 3B subunit 1